MMSKRFTTLLLFTPLLFNTPTFADAPYIEHGTCKVKRKCFNFAVDAMRGAGFSASLLADGKKDEVFGQKGHYKASIKCIDSGENETAVLSVAGASSAMALKHIDVLKHCFRSCGD